MKLGYYWLAENKFASCCEPGGITRVVVCLLRHVHSSLVCYYVYIQIRHLGHSEYRKMSAMREIKRNKEP